LTGRNVTQRNPISFEAPYDRWVSRAEWGQFVLDNGDGQEHMATAPLGGFDPDACIPLRVHTERRAWTFEHPNSTASKTVDPATRLGAEGRSARA
jgi:hypothetical protein